MIVQWMASAVACAAIVGASALCIERVVAGRLAVRRVVWFVAILGSALVPFVTRRGVARAEASRRVSAFDDGARSAPGVVGVTRATRTIDVALVGLWALASGVFGLVLLVAHRGTLRELRRASRRSIGGCDAYLTDAFGPAVVGVVAPRVVVPSWVLRLPDDEQTLIVAHEVEHARAHDPLLAFAALVAVVALPWNVALWWQLARLRLAIEIDCDARVVQRGLGGSTTYARVLLDASELARAAANAVRHPALALAHTRSSLGDRLDALLAPTSPRIVQRASGFITALALLASVAFVPGPRGRIAFATLAAASRNTTSLRPAARTLQRTESRDMAGSNAVRPSATVATPAPGSLVRSSTDASASRARDGIVARQRENLVASLGSRMLPPPSIIDPAVTNGLVVHAAPLPPRSDASAGVIRARGGASALNPTIRERVFAPSVMDTSRGRTYMRHPAPDSTLGSVSAGAVIRPRRDSTRTPPPNH